MNLFSQSTAEKLTTLPFGSIKLAGCAASGNTL